MRHDGAERWPRSRQDIAEITSETDEIRETESDVAKLPTEVAIASSAAVFGRSKLATAGRDAPRCFMGCVCGCLGDLAECACGFPGRSRS